jgi:hypothetical protein
MSQVPKSVPGAYLIDTFRTRRRYIVFQPKSCRRSDSDIARARAQKAMSKYPGSVLFQSLGTGWTRV